MYIVVNLCEQRNFEIAVVPKVKSFFEQQERLKDVKDEEKLFYGGAEAGKLGLVVCT